MNVFIRPGLLLLAGVLAAAAQAAVPPEEPCPQGVPPRFEDYAETPVAARPPHAKLVLDNSFARMFRTRLRTALREDEIDFAGSKILVTFGCGSGCVYGGIVDARSGRAQALGLTVHVFGGLRGWDSVFRHRADSRLLGVRGVLREEDERPMERYFEWTGSAFRPLCVLPVPANAGR